MAKFSFDNNLKGDFVVVHQPSAKGVAAFVAKSDADNDAADRNRRATDLQLTCTYEVKPHSEGHPITKTEWEDKQAAKKEA